MTAEVGGSGDKVHGVLVVLVPHEHWPLALAARLLLEAGLELGDRVAEELTVLLHGEDLVRFEFRLAAFWAAGGGCWRCGF